MKAVLEESAIPRKLLRCFDPYHEIADDRKRREAVVTLHREGWADKAIAGYLKIDRSTVYRVRKRFEKEGDAGLLDRPAGRQKGVQKVGPEGDGRGEEDAGEPRTREVQGTGGSGADGYRPQQSYRRAYSRRQPRSRGPDKPSRGRKEKRKMPFEASFRHEIWTSDVRYLDHAIPETGQAYVVAILENYSRAILASAVTLAQDTNAYLSVLHAAIERYGLPKRSSPTEAGSSVRIGPEPSTKLSASRRRRSSVGSPGNPSSSPTSTYSAGLRTTSSRKPRAGRNW